MLSRAASALSELERFMVSVAPKPEALWASTPGLHGGAETGPPRQRPEVLLLHGRQQPALRLVLTAPSILKSERDLH